MDFTDRIELFIRFTLLALLGLFGDVTGNIFTKQLRKVEGIVDNEFDEEIQSSESDSCSMAEEAFECVGDNQDNGSADSREGVEEGESSRIDGGESNESVGDNQ